MPNLGRVYPDYERFSEIFDRAFQARTTGWSADEAQKRLGIMVARNGDYLAYDAEQRSSQALQQKVPGYGSRNYNHGPDMPYEEEEFKKQNKARPRRM